MSKKLNYHLAIDIGGTFTDTVVFDDENNVCASNKTLTTHANPTDGALEGGTRALGSINASFRDVGRLIHGTTLATNSLLEKRGARVATVTTEGFRDILEIAYERRYDQYNIGLEKPDYLVPRERAFTFPERMSVNGQPLLPFQADAFPRLLRDLEHVRAEAVAICFLHAYANPENEIRLRDALARERPDLTVSLSSEVSPEAREFDRLSTTVANAFIQPLMSTYLADFEREFAIAGLTCPILMMTAGGGMTTLDVARRLPIRLVESGPAGGAILAARIASEAGLRDVLSFDMGGTTAKLCLIDNARPQTSRHFEIGRAARFTKGSGMPVRIPVIEMIEIGAGGGSIASVDPLGRLTVGPESAGSEPGPAAFDQGGMRATVTDADAVLGYLDPDEFAEGRIALNVDAAKRVITDDIGSCLSLSVDAASDGISGIVDEAMASAARAHAAEAGKDLGERTMIAFGGNGPLHACRVARSAGVRRVLVPPNPGIGSAVGFLFAPVSFEIVQSRYSLLQELDLSAANSFLASMIEEAEGVVRLAAPEEKLDHARHAFMRYRGQGHEIEIQLPDRNLDPCDIYSLRDAFEKEYSKQFSRPVPGMEIEILNWSVRVATPAEVCPEAAWEVAQNDIAPDKTCQIFCDVTHEWGDAAVIARADLRPGDRFSGPALVREPQTTTFVAADFACEVDARGNLNLIRKPS